LRKGVAGGDSFIHSLLSVQNLVLVESHQGVTSVILSW